MFGIFSKPLIHEPLEQQRDDVLNVARNAHPSVAAIAQEAARLTLAGADCDEVPGASGAFGSLTNPIPVNGAIGEIKYLGKLRGVSGSALFFHRLGSTRSPIVEHPVDRYEVVCMDGTQWNELYFDVYHPRRSNLAPPGYTLMPFMKDMGTDLPYAFGSNSVVKDFPHGLVTEVVRLYGQHPGRTLSRHVQAALDKSDFHRRGGAMTVDYCASLIAGAIREDIEIYRKAIRNHAAENASQDLIDSLEQEFWIVELSVLEVVLLLTKFPPDMARQLVPMLVVGYSPLKGKYFQDSMPTYANALTGHPLSQLPQIFANVFLEWAGIEFQEERTDVNPGALEWALATVITGSLQGLQGVVAGLLKDHTVS